MIKKLARQTKVIWSLGNSALDDSLAEIMANAEVDCVRVLLGKDDDGRLGHFLKMLNARIAETQNAGLKSIMLDIGRPARAYCSDLEAPRELLYGETVTLSPHVKPGVLSVKTEYWDSLFEPDATVYLGFGLVVLKVIQVHENFVDAQVIQGGTVYPETEIHVPSTRPVPTFEALETNDLDSILKIGVDYIVTPGFSDPDELDKVKKHIKKQKNSQPFIILKIDSGDIVRHLDNLLESVDGVMISRREIALSVDPATVPMLTKQIIQKCNDRAKMVCTASEMLASMRRNPTPTRAEVSDIANSVTDGTDAVVISEEVSCGRFSERAMNLVNKIIEAAEEQIVVRPNWVKFGPTISTEMDAVAYGAYRTVKRVHAKALVCITHSGNTPLKLASFQPEVPIVAVTFDERVLRRLSLIRGVDGFVLDADLKIDDVLPQVGDRLKRDSWLRSGDSIVFVSITLSSIGREASNLFTIQKVS